MPYLGRYVPPLIDGVAFGLPPRTRHKRQLAVSKRIEDRGIEYESGKCASESIFLSSFRKLVSSRVEAGFGKLGPRPRCKSCVYRRNLVERGCRHQPHGGSAEL